MTQKAAPEILLCCIVKLKDINVDLLSYEDFVKLIFMAGDVFVSVSSDREPKGVIVIHDASNFSMRHALNSTLR